LRTTTNCILMVKHVVMNYV